MCFFCGKEAAIQKRMNQSISFKLKKKKNQSFMYCERESRTKSEVQKGKNVISKHSLIVH